MNKKILALSLAIALVITCVVLQLGPSSYGQTGAGLGRETPKVVTTNPYGYVRPFATYMVNGTGSAVVNTTLTGAYAFYCNNTTAGALTVTISDNQVSPIAFVSAFSLAANSNIRFPPGEGYLQMRGIQVNAAAGVNCTAWGSQ